MLGRGGWAKLRGVRSSWGLGGPGSMGGGNVDGGGGSGASAVRAKAGKKGGNIAGVRERESARRVVVMEGETKELGRDGMGFAMIEGGKGRDKKLKVREVVVFDTEVSYHQDKSNRTRDVMEKTRSRSFEEAVGSKMGDKAVLRELVRLL
jgi:hypothetical protein